VGTLRWEVMCEYRNNFRLYMCWLQDMEADWDNGEFPVPSVERALVQVY
jgi:hypothetical protein